MAQSQLFISKIFEHQNHSSDVLPHVVKDINVWTCRYRKLSAELNAWWDWIINC